MKKTYTTRPDADPRVIVPRTDSKLLRVLAKTITWIFHPVFMPTIVTVLLYWVSATRFAQVSGPHFGQWLAIIILNTLFFPLFIVFLLRKLDFITEIHMHDPKDRILPLIGSMVCYFWADHVFANMQPQPPFILHVLLLGTFWGIIAIFMVNIFYKVSIHTTAAGGVIGITIVLMMLSPVSMLLPLFIALFFAGLIGTARLLLGAHSPAQIYMGYILGILCEVGAYYYLS